jgi:hypothetical protein
MKLKGWIVSALLAGGVVLGVRASGRCLSAKAPDEQLAGHLDDLATSLATTSRRPSAACATWPLLASTEDMLGEFGATMQLIEKIPDDDKHDKRRTSRVIGSSARCARASATGTIRRGGRGRSEASALLQRGLDRIGRTFEIIFSGAEFDFRTLPARLARRLDR